MKALLDRFNLNEGVFDLAFLAYMVLGGRVLDADIVAGSEWIAMLAAVLPAFMLPWYLGEVVARYAGATRRFMASLGLFVLIVSLVIGLVYNIAGLIEMGLSAWALPAGLVGFILGSVLGIVLFVIRREATGDEGELLQLISLGVVFIILLPVAGLALAAWMGLELQGFAVIALLVLSLGGGIGLLILYFVTLHESVQQTAAYGLARKYATDLIFPLLIATAFIFWQSLERDLAARAGNNAWDRFWFLTLTGMLPFRLVLLLTPPFRLPNFVLGIATLALAFIGGTN